MPRVWPFAGREPHLHVLTSVLRRDNGSDAVGAVVTGPAGIGRTRLIHAALAQSGTTVRWASGTAAAAGLPLAALAPLLVGRESVVSSLPSMVQSLPSMVQSLPSAV